MIYFYTMIFMYFSSLMTSSILLPNVRLELQTFLLKMLYSVTLEAENEIHVNIELLSLFLNSPCDLQINFRGTWLAQVVEQVTLELRVVSLSPTLGIERTKKIKNK